MNRFALIASTLIALALTCIGCGPKDGGDPASSTTGSAGNASGGTNAKKLKIGVVFDKGGLNDKSFNDSAWAGVQRAMKEFGVEEIHVETKEEKDYTTNLAAMAEKDCDIVFAIGISQEAALKEVAPQFKDTKFAIVDGRVESENTRCLLFKEEEGSLLVGYLAGQMTQSKKLGFVGGMDLGLIHKFLNGFKAGAMLFDPTIEILPPKFTGNWDNVDQAKAAANLLIQQGADVVYHAAGRAGLGVIKAAKDAGKWAIGVDSDQDYVEPGSVLTSMVKRVDVAVYQTIKDLVDGKFTPGEQIYDLKADGVSISELKYTKDKIGAEKLAKLNEIKKMIVDGTTKAPATDEEFTTFAAGLKR